MDISLQTDYEKTMLRLYKLGCVFQDYALVRDLTVMENVSLTAMLRKDRIEEQTKEEGHNILQKIGMCDRRAPSSPENSPAASNSMFLSPVPW
jgi:putative ABC transport system ATP-binding protein